jgi:sigma-54 specific flagellar transcriptional regulator A
MARTDRRVSLDHGSRLLIGESAAIRELRSLIGRVAASDASVLVTGPSGSGKELVARAIHQASGRAGQAFVALNCGAIPAELMESELFGHERGAFTGASARRIGRFEEAHRGTLFLDEIGDMRFDMQVKLLRVLEDGLVQRVGGGAPFVSDVRIVSATHQDIDGAIAANRFREDLYFRLGVVPIRVPSLAERVDDLPLLIAHFRQKRSGAPIARFDRDAMMRLMAHDWPGNVRELRNVVERADILFAGALIGAGEVEALLGLKAAQGVPCTLVPPQEETPLVAEPIDLKDLIERVEQERIQSALEAAQGVISEAARLLTLKRTTLIEKMRKYGVGTQAA